MSAAFTYFVATMANGQPYTKWHLRQDCAALQRTAGKIVERFCGAHEVDWSDVCQMCEKRILRSDT